LPGRRARAPLSKACPGVHSARVWYTKDAGSASGPWDTQTAALLLYRPDGYPTQIPQKVAGHSFAQKVATIWADASAWPEGTYTILFDGKVSALPIIAGHSSGLLRIAGLEGRGYSCALQIRLVKPNYTLIDYLADSATGAVAREVVEKYADGSNWVKSVGSRSSVTSPVFLR